MNRQTDRESTSRGAFFIPKRQITLYLIQKITDSPKIK